MEFELAGTSLDVREPDALARVEDLTWVPALVPGGVHESLIAAGLIAHPYAAENEKAIRWIEDRVWWFRAVVRPPAGRVPGDRLRLVLEAVDTVASIWLDGRLVARSANQFVPVEVDVSDLSAGEHELLVCCTPPLEGLVEPPRTREMVERIKAFFAAAVPQDQPATDEPPAGMLSIDLASTLRRKAQFSWGWDFAPRVPSIGLTGPVRLVHDTQVRISDHRLRTTSLDRSAGLAEVVVDVEVEHLTGPVPHDLQIVLTSPQGRKTEAVLPLEDGRCTGRLQIREVSPWWTHDLGEPSLYDAHLVVRDSDGEVLASLDEHFGIRTIELDQSPGELEGGRRFTFVLNGVPLFARGANWVPASMLVGSVTAADHDALVGLARDAQMNMLRVWAGGIYEPSSFYDACDRLGILVWQDFLFACLDYPTDDAVLRSEVRREAAYQVRRLRRHPSLAIWVGNNEVHAMHQLVWGNLEPGSWGHDFFHVDLPDAVAEHAPGTLYWPGSPWASPEVEIPVNGTLDGDRHAWEVWHGADLGAGGPSEFAGPGEAMHFSRYAYDRGRFISEFGLHASAELSTLDRWVGPGRLTLDGPILAHRNKDTPARKGFALLEVETGLPTTITQYVGFSQAVQAEGLKFGIEHYRRRQPHTSGTLLWQLDEPWPGMTWSIVDHDHIAKPGYYFVQRAYAPVLASFVQRDGDLELWVTNSAVHDISDEARVEIQTFAGDPVLDQVIPVAVPALTSGPVWRVPLADIAAGPDRFAWVSSAAGTFADNRTFFGRLRELPLSTGTLDLDIRRTGPGQAQVRIRSRGYNYLTRVLAPAPRVAFSTNAVDLRDGGETTIELRGLAEDFDPNRLQVRSFADDLAGK
jgi:beta-mannosidase